MELGELLTKYDKALDDLDCFEYSKNFIYDAQLFIKNQIRELYEKVYNILSSINLICWCMHNGFEHEYIPFIYRFYKSLDSEIDDINRFPILYKYIDINEIYRSAIFYKEYGFPDTLKEFIENNMYIDNFVERYNKNDNGK